MVDHHSCHECVEQRPRQRLYVQARDLFGDGAGTLVRARTLLHTNIMATLERIALAWRLFCVAYFLVWLLLERKASENMPQR
ncbi:hypothetical protein [Xanthomonas campestris]